jgi:hypothetical protein
MADAFTTNLYLDQAGCRGLLRYLGNVLEAATPIWTPWTQCWAVPSSASRFRRRVRPHLWHRSRRGVRHGARLGLYQDDKHLGRLGTAAGALDTGAIANSTWYHVWLIERVDTGVVDVLFSLSATAPTMPANYTRKRRIGSMKDGRFRALGYRSPKLATEFLWGVNQMVVDGQ